MLSARAECDALRCNSHVIVYMFCRINAALPCAATAPFQVAEALATGAGGASDLRAAALDDPFVD